MSFKKRELEEIIRRLINSDDITEKMSREDFKSLVFYAIDESAETDNKQYNMMMEVIRGAFSEKMKYIKSLEEENDRLKVSINQLRAQYKPSQQGCSCGCSDYRMTIMPQSVQQARDSNKTEMAILNELATADNPEGIDVINGPWTKVNIEIKKKLVDARMIIMFCGNEEQPAPEPQPEESQEEAPEAESAENVNAYESCAKMVDAFINKLTDSDFDTVLKMEADTEAKKHFVKSMNELADLVRKLIGISRLNKDSYEKLHTECEDFREAIDIIRRCIANGESINPFGVKDEDIIYPYLNGLSDDINELIDDNAKYKKCISNQVQTMYLMVDHITDSIPTKTNETLGDWGDDEYFNKQFKDVDSKFIAAYNGLLDSIKDKDEFIDEIVRLAGFFAVRPSSIHPDTFQNEISKGIIAAYNSVNEEFYSYITAAVYKTQHKIVTPLADVHYPAADNRYKLIEELNNLIIDFKALSGTTLNIDKSKPITDMNPMEVIGLGVPFLGLFKTKANRYVARVACFMQGKGATEYYSGAKIDGELVIAVPIPENMV